MFCKSCGQQIDDFALACPQCGAATSSQTQAPPPAQQYQPPVYQAPQYQQPTYQQPGYQQPYQTSNVADVPSGGMKLLSFCIPIVGLILFITWKDQKPVSAKAMGKAALIGFIIGAISSVFYYIVMFAIIGGGEYFYYSIANFATKFFN